MSWIVTRLCRDCMDTACVSVCPVDCIYRYQGEDNEGFPKDAVPEPFKNDVTLNYRTLDQSSDFVVQNHEPKGTPAPEQIEANRAKWGLAL